MMKHKKAFGLIGIALIAIALVVTLLVKAEPGNFNLLQRIAGVSIKATPSQPLHFPSPTGSTAPGTTHQAVTGMPYVQGAQVLDGAGHPLTLRGAQIESPFNYIKSWQIGIKVSKYLNSAVFAAMVNQWKMNALRLPISNWIYAKYSASYLSQLDQVIQEANTAGLYVILDLHDDGKSGSPYGDNAGVPKAENIPFWQAIATHYKNNPMVMFDVFNEPKSSSWSVWLHGGGTMSGSQIVGFQDLVDAIRSVGAHQIIVVEPGSAGGNALTDAGWATIGNNTVNDPNIMYSLHVYQGIVFSAQEQDTKWGPILNNHPIFYGEWALLPNGYGQSGQDHCKNIIHSQADQDVVNFLNYMSSRHASWTAWEFTPYHLIQDYTNFTPTTLDIPWVCGDANSHAGMGTIVKQFLTTNG